MPRAGHCRASKPAAGQLSLQGACPCIPRFIATLNLPPGTCRLLANRRLSEMELGLVASLAIETADEAKKLVPSLAAPTEVR